MKKRGLLSISFCLFLAVVAIVPEVSGASLPKSFAAKGSGPTVPVQGPVVKKADPTAYTVEELHKRGADLDKKEVVVHGRAVKVTSGIMGKTWTHIQDGTGDKATGTNDVICISALRGAEVGDVVTVRGTVAFHTEGRYRLVIENAVFLR